MGSARREFGGRISETGREELETEFREKRGASRHLTTLRVAKLSTDKAEGLCLVRNLSEGGMMIDAQLSFIPGEIVLVHLSDELSVKGRVIWQEKGLTGLKFDELVKIDDVLAKPGVLKNGLSPRLPRLGIERHAELKFGSLRIPALVRDISQRGVKLTLESELQTNDQVTVILEGFRPVKGSVRWRKDDQVGIIFHELVSISELMEWANRGMRHEN